MTSHSLRWLVFGATGFIGRHLTAALEDAGSTFLGASRTQGETRGDERFLRCDLLVDSDLSDVLKNWCPDVVVHLAAPSPGRDVADSNFFSSSTERLSQALREACPGAKLLVAGSAAEYGNAPVYGWLSESSPCRPLSPYGKAKLRQTQVALRARDQGTDVVVARLFNPIGPGQGSHLVAGALVRRLRSGENPLRLRNANYERDFVDVRDVAEALLTLGRQAGYPPIVNIATGRGIRVAELGRLLCAWSGSNLEEISGPVDDQHPWRSVGSPIAIKSLGWQPHRSLEESVEDLWKHTDRSPELPMNRLSDGE